MHRCSTPSTPLAGTPAPTNSIFKRCMLLSFYSVHGQLPYLLRAGSHCVDLTTQLGSNEEPTSLSMYMPWKTQHQNVVERQAEGDDFSGCSAGRRQHQSTEEHSTAGTAWQGTAQRRGTQGMSAKHGTAQLWLHSSTWKVPPVRADSWRRNRSPGPPRCSSAKKPTVWMTGTLSPCITLVLNLYTK